MFLLCWYNFVLSSALLYLRCNVAWCKRANRSTTTGTSYASGRLFNLCHLSNLSLLLINLLFFIYLTLITSFFILYKYYFNSLCHADTCHNNLWSSSKLTQTLNQAYIKLQFHLYSFLAVSQMSSAFSCYLFPRIWGRSVAGHVTTVVVPVPSYPFPCTSEPQLSTAPPCSWRQNRKIIPLANMLLWL